MDVGHVRFALPVREVLYDNKFYGLEHKINSGPSLINKN